MAKKLYVGNLSYNTTETQIRELFAPLGEITEVNVIMDRDTGKSKGFAFVQMQEDNAANEAIRRFNGHSLENRALTVSEARPREVPREPITELHRASSQGAPSPAKNRSSSRPSKLDLSAKKIPSTSISVESLYHELGISKTSISVWQAWILSQRFPDIGKCV